MTSNLLTDDDDDDDDDDGDGDDDDDDHEDDDEDDDDEDGDDDDDVVGLGSCRIHVILKVGCEVFALLILHPCNPFIRRSRDFGSGGPRIKADTATKRTTLKHSFRAVATKACVTRKGNYESESTCARGIQSQTIPTRGRVRRKKCSRACRRHLTGIGDPCHSALTRMLTF